MTASLVLAGSSSGARTTPTACSPNASILKSPRAGSREMQAKALNDRGDIVGFADARNGMYIFITDGELNDLEEVKRYTVKLCKDIQAGRRNPLKCVLIGLGENINEGQMEELDDLDSGTDVDIWDHKIAR